MGIPNLESSFEKAGTTTLDMPTDVNTHILCIPLANERGYAVIENEARWLNGNAVNNDEYHYDPSYKRITDSVEYKRFTDMMMEVHDKAGVEYFHTPDYPPKPNKTNIKDYIDGYLKAYNINSNYTFTSYHRISVDLDMDEDLTDVPKEQHNHLREEYLIIPLYIRLKEFKDFDQMKVIEYCKKTSSNPDGFVVKPVNRKFFKRDPPSSKKFNVRLPGKNNPLEGLEDLEEEIMEEDGVEL